MLSIVCWKWRPPKSYERTFTADAVNTLFRMVDRNYMFPYRPICITDDPKGIGPGIECIPLWSDFSGLASPLGIHYPSCYRRLLAFGDNFRSLVGDRFVSLDLDCVITGRLEPLWERPEDFVIWESMVRGQPYNGSMWLHRSGTRRQVLDEFDPDTSPPLARAAGFVGSDQAWFSYKLPGEPVWTKQDGVMSWNSHCRNRGWSLPTGSRIVFFQGQESPWDAHVQDRAAWIKEHYR